MSVKDSFERERTECMVCETLTDCIVYPKSRFGPGVDLNEDLICCDVCWESGATSLLFYPRQHDATAHFVVSTMARMTNLVLDALKKSK